MRTLRSDLGRPCAVGYTRNGEPPWFRCTTADCVLWRLPGCELAACPSVAVGDGPPASRSRATGWSWPRPALTSPPSTRIRRGPKARSPGCPWRKAVADYVWLAPSADGRSILGTGWRPAAPGSAHLLRWSPEGELLHWVPLCRLLMPFLAAAPDGRILAGAKGRTVFLVDIASGSEAAALEHNGEPGDLAFSADGRHLAVVVSRSVWLWDVGAAYRRPAHRLPAEWGARQLPPGRAAARRRRAGRRGQAVGGGTDAQVSRLALDIGPLHGLAFAPDGMTAAACGDGGIALWDIK